MAYNLPSPNEMIIDSSDYVDVDSDDLDKEPVVIINPDTTEESSSLQDLPLATDDEAMMDLVLAPLIDEPGILETKHHVWTVEHWRTLGKRERGPIFEVGGVPWRILLFPHGNNSDQCSIYLEHAFDSENMPDNWSQCVQFSLVLWNPNDPKLYVHHTAHHRFTKEEGDWGFTRFVELKRMFNVPWENSTRPLVEDDLANITAYVRIVEDETGVLWHNFINYDSKKETGFVGLKNQGATCYLNSLLQSLYFTNAFRKAVYEIPTETEQSMQNSAYTLQRLFYQLQTSEHAVGTTELTKSFGWETRHIFEQQDVQEMSRKLMERLEEKMKGTTAESVLPDMFCGKVKTYISCINVDYESSRIEDFWDIQLNVSGNENLLDSFKDYIEVEKMEGENQYFAGDQYKLQDANKGVIFTSFPDVLHLQLKRFEYDIERDMMMKINDRYEFPDTFDAAPYLSEDADRSESWSYQLHGVLVHSGDLNAGHYYAFLKPDKDGWFYKYDDDKVTKATMREVLEENFGGEYRTRGGGRAPLQNKTPVLRQNSAYMLVYIRQSRLDKILPPVSTGDAPEYMRSRLEEEINQREARKQEQREAHLYMMAKVVTSDAFKTYGGTDLCAMDADPEVDPSAPKPYRIRRKMMMEEFVTQIADDMKKDRKIVRLWLMVNRQNKTIRPDAPITAMQVTVEETLAKAAANKDSALRVWAEVAEDLDDQGNPIWPAHQAQGNGDSAKNDLICILLKHFDEEAQTLRGVGHVYFSKDKKVEELVPTILKKMSWMDSSDMKLALWEEIKPTMIEPLKSKLTLKSAELQDGDIICFQRVPAASADGPNFSEKGVPRDTNIISERFETAKEYYDFLEHRRLVKFHLHPTKPSVIDFPPFELMLNSKLQYETLAERVGAHIKAPATHIRFWTVNASTNNPKAPVRRSTNPSLRHMLNPMGNVNTFNSSQRNDAFYLEVLDMSLEEFETMKIVKLVWLPEGIIKEEPLDVLVPKTANIEDLIKALIKKAQIADEAEGGKLRVFETNSGRVYREPARHDPVLGLSEYTQVYVERIPEDEPEDDGQNFIQVFHFHNEVNRTHGVPFKFPLIQGEKFVDTKKRLEKRTGIKGKSFEKIKFSVIRRSSFVRPHILEDDDELRSLVNTDEDFLGFDHVDRSRAPRNGGGDLFLR